MFKRILCALGFAPEPMLSERELLERECEIAAADLAACRTRSLEVAP